MYKVLLYLIVFFFSLQIYWGFWIPEKLVEKTQVCIKFLIRS